MIVVDTTDPAFSRDPHQILRDARVRSPIAFDAFGTPMLLRYADVDAALKDPRFINDYDILITRHGITSGPLYDWWKLAMLNTNPPVHTRLRGLASRAFTPRAANGTRERMRALTVEHLRVLEGRDSIDLIDDVTESLPLTIVCDMIGVPRDDHHSFHQWVADIGLMFSDSIPDENRARAEHAMFALGDYVVEMIEHKRRAPDDSLMSTLIVAEEDGDRLSYDELVALVVNLMLGALDTSRSALSIGLWLLWTHNLRTVTPALIEEILRYEAAVGRIATDRRRRFRLVRCPGASRYQRRAVSDGGQPRLVGVQQSRCVRRRALQGNPQTTSHVRTRIAFLPGQRDRASRDARGARRDADPLSRSRSADRLAAVGALLTRAPLRAIADPAG
jgi:cytochrome P450